MDIEIRKINQQDKEAFIELSLALTKFNKRQHSKYYSNSQEFLEVRKQRVEERFDKINQSPSKIIFIAFIDNKPAGYIRAFTYDKKLRCGCLDELYLIEEARGQGIGKKLLGAVTQWMAEQKVIRMIVSVYLWNTPARKLYEEEGFLEYSSLYEKAIGTAVKLSK